MKDRTALCTPFIERIIDKADGSPFARFRVYDACDGLRTPAAEGPASSSGGVPGAVSQDTKLTGPGAASAGFMRPALVVVAGEPGSRRLRACRARPAFRR